MKKTTLFLILFLLVTPIVLLSQPAKHFIMNTGYNPVSKTKLIQGERDRCWVVVQVPDFYDEVPPYDAFATYYPAWNNNPPSDPNIPNSEYITPVENSHHYGNEEPHKPIILKKDFYVSKDCRVKVFGELIADNYGKLYIDTVFITDTENRMHNFPSFFDDSLHLSKGNHTIYLYLINWENHTYQPLGIKLSGLIVPYDDYSDVVFSDFGCFGELPIEDNLASNNGPVCEFEDLHLYCQGEHDDSYYWSGPNNFYSREQNPIIRKAAKLQTGIYSVYKEKNGVKSPTYITEAFVTSPDVDPGDSSLVFAGAALRKDNFLRLTTATTWQHGSIWLKRKFSIKKDFYTRFQFRVSEGNQGIVDWEGSEPGADGLAFVFQNQDYPSLGNAGVGIGYTGIPYSLAIEIDLFKNRTEGDPNGNHIAVQSLGKVANTTDHQGTGLLAINDSIMTILPDKIFYVEISYDYLNRTMRIYLDTTSLLSSPVLVLSNLDLGKLLELEDEEYVYIGFTSATGLAYQNHDILRWTVPCDNLMTGISEDNDVVGSKLGNEKTKVYPNPASNVITLDFNLQIDGIVSVSFFDVFGKEILNGYEQYYNSGNHQEKINLENLLPGVYFVKINYSNKTYINKIVITK